MNIPISLSTAMKDEPMADHQSNQVLPQRRKPKVLPKKETPRLPRSGRPMVVARQGLPVAKDGSG
jgi:hypothetical protein